VGRLLDAIPAGVPGVRKISKSNAESCNENCDDAAADTLSKPEKYEKDSESVLALVEKPDWRIGEPKARLDGRADEMPVHSVACRTRGVASLKKESGEIMPLSSSGVRGSVEEAKDICRDPPSSSAVSVVVELQLEK
jgi:hypothetical protein